MKIFFLIMIAILAFSFSGCSFFVKKTTIKEKEVVKIITTRDTVAESTPETVKPVVKEAPVYFVIGGCFRYKENANRLCNKLQNEGYANALMMPYRKDLYLVAYDGYTTRQKAVVAIRKLHQLPGKCDTWLYQIK